MKSPLEKAISSVGITQLARVVGVRPPTIHVWLRSTGHVPAHHVLAVEAATGVSRYELRPDVYGPAPDEQDRAA
jgi:DNA-binding transcriptional regulator YdaS (Cro superfamily)